MSTKFNCTTTALSAVLIASFVGTTTSILHAEGIKPDATLLRFPDVSQSHIVFTYANDLWLVPKSGGSAQKVASPHGQVMLPRFSPDGNTLVSVGADKALLKWDLQSATNAGSIQAHKAWIRCVKYSPDHRFSCTGPTLGQASQVQS